MTAQKYGCYDPSTGTALVSALDWKYNLTDVRAKVGVARNLAELNYLITAAGSNDVAIEVIDTITLTEDLTIPENIQLIPHYSSLFSGAYKLTTNGPFSAYLYQVFDTDITVTFGYKAVQKMYFEWWGAVADGILIQDANISSGDNTLTSITASFTSAHVGKTIVVTEGAASKQALITTIASYTSATEVELTDAAGTDVVDGYAHWGTDNTTALQKAIDDSLESAGVVELAGGFYLTEGLIIESSSVKIQGIDYNNSGFYSAIDTGKLLHFKNPLGNKIRSTTLRNVRFWGTGRTGDEWAIYYDGLSSSHMIENYGIFNFANGLHTAADYFTAKKGRVNTIGYVVEDDNLSISAAGTTLVSGNNPWTEYDVGMTITIAGAGTGGIEHTTTIASFTGIGEVELTDAAITTSLSADGFWGNPDTGGGVSIGQGGGYVDFKDTFVSLCYYGMTADADSQHISVRACNFESSIYGVSFPIGDGWKACHFDGCHFEANNFADFVLENNQYHTVLTACRFGSRARPALYGIRLQNSDNNIVLNDCRWTASSVYAEIYGVAGSRVIVLGNYNNLDTVLGDVEVFYTSNLKVDEDVTIYPKKINVSTSDVDFTGGDDTIGVFVAGTEGAGDGNEGNKIVLGNAGVGLNGYAYLCSYQDGANQNYTGVRIYVHPSSVALDSPLKAFELNRQGALTLNAGKSEIILTVISADNRAAIQMSDNDTTSYIGVENGSIFLGAANITDSIIRANVTTKLSTVEGGLQTKQGRILNTTRITSADSPYTDVVTNDFVEIYTTAIFTYNLLAGVNGTRRTLKNTGTYVVNLVPNVAETIENSILNPGESYDLRYTTARGWIIV